MKRDAETLSKKKAVHPKGEAAKARKSVLEAQQNDRDAREKEDQQWLASQGNTSRAAKKREEDAKKRAEAAARKAGNRRLAEQEERDLEKTSMMIKKPDPKEPEQQPGIRKKVEGEEKGKKSRITDQKEYKKMVLVSNTNQWDDSVMESNAIEEAIGQNRKQDYWPVRNRHERKKIMATVGKSRKSFLLLANDDEERCMLVDSGRIKVDRSCLDLYEYYPAWDQEDEFVDRYFDNYCHSCGGSCYSL